MSVCQASWHLCYTEAWTLGDSGNAGEMLVEELPEQPLGLGIVENVVTGKLQCVGEIAISAQWRLSLPPWCPSVGKVTSVLRTRHRAADTHCCPAVPSGLAWVPCL